MPDEDLSQSIAESAAGPARSVIDGEVSEEHPLPDQIAADRYLAGKSAPRNRAFGLRRVKVIHPGTA